MSDWLAEFGASFLDHLQGAMKHDQHNPKFPFTLKRNVISQPNVFLQRLMRETMLFRYKPKKKKWKSCLDTFSYNPKIMGF